MTGSDGDPVGTATETRRWTISKSRHDETICDECVEDSPVWYSDNHGSASVVGPDTEEVTVVALDDVTGFLRERFALDGVADSLAERFGGS
jgi:hypothetical protein